jgi:senataxin
MRKDVHSSSEFIGVRVKSVLTASSDYKDRSFISNDIVLLVREESYIWEAYGGTLLRRKRQQQQQGPGQSRQPNRYGIVGYIEYTRRSIEGLTVQVSKEFWSDVGTSEMVLLKLGCNITSLREFTALCRMDSIPLLDYILRPRAGAAGPTTRIKGEDSYAAAIDPSPSDEKRAKRDVLSMMGGPSALGKGFVDYASRKFNLSQLGAISASAQEYGEGGFTLIKGPPGTGKVRLM